MKNPPPFFGQFYSAGILILGWVIVIVAAYGRLLLHPDFHTACPENDIWNLPIRWSVLTSLRDGKIPLWNSLLSFGCPWVAMWTTEVFYPGILLFTWLGLSAWNLSGILHLLIFSTGVYHFLRSSGVRPFASFFSGVVGLLNVCAYNHLGSNSPMDAMAWMPWIFYALEEHLQEKPYGDLKLGAFFTLQIFAGYPQTTLYTLTGCLAYSFWKKGWRSLRIFIAPIAISFLVTTCQWFCSMEFYLFNAVRLPAVANNPYLILPLENLKTFLGFNALSKPGIPDYYLSPSFFYFNYYCGLIPLTLLLFGIIRFNHLGNRSRFFILSFLATLLWAVGPFPTLFHFFHLPFPAFLEPAKDYILANVFELFTLGFLMEDLFPKPGKWKWVILTAVILNLLIPIWNHPLEKNLFPPNSKLETEAQKLKNQLGSGRILILPDAKERSNLFSPSPDTGKKQIFKHFIPNSNLFCSLPVATIYSSTWPTWGGMDAARYFQCSFPYAGGTLLDLLGIDLLYLPTDKMPSRFRKIKSEDGWTLWNNPNSLGSGFMFSGQTLNSTRKEAFESFANGAAQPLRTLYLDPQPISLASKHFSDFYHPSSETVLLPKGAGGYWVVTQNAMPGWRAWVDGVPVDIFLADGIFQCVRIPANAGWVKLLYEPSSFRFGLFISLLSLAGLIALAGLRKSGRLHF